MLALLGKEAYDFLLFIEQKDKKETGPLKKFGLGLEAFEFWNDENETDYSIEDTKEYNEQQTAPVTLIVDIKKYSERTSGTA